MKKLAATLMAWGPGGLFLFSFLDGAGLPMPGGVDVLIVFLSAQGFSMPLLVFLATLGSVLGNLILFWIAKRGGEIYLARHTESRSGARFRRWFHHYGLLTVFTAALVPLPVMPMKIFTLCSGALGSPVTQYVVVLAGARVARYTGLAALGQQMGTNALAYVRSHVPHLAAFALLLFAFLYLLVKIADKRRSSASAAQS